MLLKHIPSDLNQNLEAPPGFEPGMEVCRFSEVVNRVVSCWSLVPSSTTVLPNVWALVDYIWTTTQPWQRVAPERIPSAIAIACYPASTFRGLPPKRPFVRELAALR